MKVIGIVQARVGSARLPGKVLAELAGATILEALFTRVRGAALDEVWLATTTLANDDRTAATARAAGADVFRGEVDDVLSRFTAIARERRPDWVVRLTADDPFVDRGAIDALVASTRAAAATTAVVSEVPSTRRTPLGYVPQIVRANALLGLTDAIPEHAPWHRTHVLTWFYDNNAVAPVTLPGDWPRRPSWRWTVDTAEDLAMARGAFDAFGARWADADYPAMVASLDQRPDICCLNARVTQKRVEEG